MTGERWPEIPDDVPERCEDCGRVLLWRETGRRCSDCGNERTPEDYPDAKENP